MNSKIDISVGDLSFSGEGDQAWLTQQLDKVLNAVPKIADARRTSEHAASENGEERGATTLTTTLAAYIREKKGESNQVDRFLITADWLRRRGTAKLTTVAVSAALRDNQQKKLTNPADCLNGNVSKGYCEKADGGFFITPDGLKHLKVTA